MQKEGNGARITITLKGWYFKDGNGCILLENSVKTDIYCQPFVLNVDAYFYNT